MRHSTCCSAAHSFDCSRRELLASSAFLGLASWSGVSAAAAQTAAGGAYSASMPRSAALKPFDVRDVRLGDGPFLDAQRRSAAYLLSLDPDRLLHAFRVNAGLKPKAPLYGGWESDPTWADIHCQGHSLGHYLSACSLMGAATGDSRFKRRVGYIVTELAECQKASGSGLLCAFPEGPKLVAAFIAGGNVPGVPWYTMHKVFAGLRDAYQEGRNAQALDVLMRFADWAISATRGLSDQRFEAMLDTEHGGMNEVFADLFQLTGKPDYRWMAQRFSHKAMLDPLARSEDHLDGLHANTQIPKIVGFERVFEVAGDERYRKAAAFFWRTVANGRSYATGGHGDQEHFYPMVDAAQHVFSAKGSETCGVYNMLKLTRLLFMADPQADYADFYERALYNGILGSQDPVSGMVTYFQGARPGYMKLYCTPVNSFWCCTGTGMENHAKYGDSIYFRDERSLFVNLYISSTVRWAEQDALVTQTTRFPEQSSTRLEWSLRRPAELTLKLRHPAWSPVAEVRVNGAAALRSDRPGSFIALDRRWQDGDTVELFLSPRVRAVQLPDTPHIFALTYGPLVLAAALGDEGIAPGSDIVVNERKYGEYLDTPFEAPLLSGEPADIAERVRQEAKPLRFVVPDASGRPIPLLPYYQIAHQRYATYWSAGAVG